MPRRRPRHSRTSYTDRPDPNATPRSAARTRRAAISLGQAFARLFSGDAGPGLLLVLISWAAFANAWPNALVFDDKYFLVAERFAGLGPTGLVRLFVEDLWAGYGADSGLYRPLFTAIITCEWALFGDWSAGYHLVNIALHAAVTLGVFRLAHGLLVDAAPGRRRLAAFLAAAVFAVHPLHAEVVNSVFNGSALWGALGVVGGLLWLNRHIEARPGRAWGGLALIYLLTLMTRETAVVLPALAALLVLLYASGSWPNRIRRALPVVGLAVPLGIYLVLRASALAPDGGALQATEISALAGVAIDMPPDRLFGWSQALEWAKSWLVGLSLWLWPHPLALHHPVDGVPAWLALGLLLLLGIAAVIALIRGRPALPAGLAFFYVAIFPASLVMGRTDTQLGFQERFIYLPSVGLTLLLAAGLLWLARARGARWAVLAGLTAALLLTPLTWARNADWADNLRLFRSDYERGDHSPRLVGLIVLDLLVDGELSAAARYCDRHAATFSRSGKFAESCGQAYGALGRTGDAEQALLTATDSTGTRASSQQLLGDLYARTGRRVMAEEHFSLAVEREPMPAMRELRKAHMLYALYPDDPGRRREAMHHVERALAMQPRMVPALQLRDRLLAATGKRAR